MIDLITDEVRKLNSEGKTDKTIADTLGISRVTVSRIRLDNGIPRAALALVKKIRELSQEYGLRDKEIAKKTRCLG